MAVEEGGNTREPNRKEESPFITWFQLHHEERLTALSGTGKILVEAQL